MKNRISEIISFFPGIKVADHRDTNASCESGGDWVKIMLIGIDKTQYEDGRTYDYQNGGYNLSLDAPDSFFFLLAHVLLLINSSNTCQQNLLVNVIFITVIYELPIIVLRYLFLTGTRRAGAH